MRPLADLRIVAIEQFGAGPFGTLQLADLGAEVIKLEDPRVGGDVARYVPPYASGEDSLFFEAFNRNKRSISLDLATAAGRRVFEDLVAKSDVVFSNLRGDVPEKMRIRYSDLAHCNPRIVCCSLSGFGMSGPARARPAYDYILQGLAGWMDITGEPDGPPTKSGLSLVDYCGGLVAAIAMLAGVHAARRDGTGCDCDLSLFDTAISLLTYPGTWHLNEGFEPRRARHSAHPSIVPFGVFATADGWIVIACAKEKFWQRAAAALGLDALAEDQRFRTLADRQRNAPALLEILERRLLTRSSTEWIEALSAAGVPCGPVNTVAQALADPQTHARELILETEHPRFGTLSTLASPVRVGDERPAVRRAPQRDEDADRVLRELLGYGDQELATLRAAQAFGESSASADGR